MDQDNRIFQRRNEKENRRDLSRKLFPGDSITHKDVGLEKDRRKDNRRSSDDRREIGREGVA